MLLFINTNVRCTAHRKDLDGKEDVCPRHHKHTRALLNAFRSQVLWKEYGVVDDILVGSLHSYIIIYLTTY